MELLYQHHLERHVVRFQYSTRSDGDLAARQKLSLELKETRQRIFAGEWYHCQQIHSDSTIVIDHKAQPFIANDQPTPTAPVGDALASRQSGIALAVQSADCATVGLVSDLGSYAVVHAGWKGLERGVIESALRSLRQLDAKAQVSESKQQAKSADIAQVHGCIGPHISVQKYEFGSQELTRLAQRFSLAVIGQTAWGTAALDLGEAVRFELKRLGIQISAQANACTAKDEANFWSHRARKETSRINLVAIKSSIR